MMGRRKRTFFNRTQEEKNTMKKKPGYRRITYANYRKIDPSLVRSEIARQRVSLSAVAEMISMPQSTFNNLIIEGRFPQNFLEDLRSVLGIEIPDLGRWDPPVKAAVDSEQPEEPQLKLGDVVSPLDQLTELAAELTRARENVRTIEDKIKALAAKL
jgi:hypothetical protein